jgi:D-proline reductase (dithiol) PrdB
VGLIQNALEAAGIATASLTTMPEITMGVGVPRAGFVRFPLGTPFGEPGHTEVQRAILLDLLRLVWEAEGPQTVVKLPYRWRRGLSGRA